MFSHARSVTLAPDVTDRRLPKPAEINTCYGVTDGSREQASLVNSLPSGSNGKGALAEVERAYVATKQQTFLRPELIQKPTRHSQSATVNIDPKRKCFMWAVATTTRDCDGTLGDRTQIRVG